MQNLSHLPEPLLADDDQLSLAELVNRVLDRGAVINGDVLISVAGVDLLYVGLRVMLSSIETMQARRGGDFAAECSRPEAASPDQPAPVRRG